MYIYINITIERIICWYYWYFNKKANEYKLFSIRTDVQDICFFIFPQHSIFIIWKFHAKYPHHTCFPFLSDSPSQLYTLHQKRKKICKSNLYCSYTHWGMGKFLVASPLKIIESFSNPARNHQLWTATAQQLSHSY